MLLVASKTLASNVPNTRILLISSWMWSVEPWNAKVILNLNQKNSSICGKNERTIHDLQEKVKKEELKWLKPNKASMQTRSQVKFVKLDYMVATKFYLLNQYFITQWSVQVRFYPRTAVRSFLHLLNLYGTRLLPKIQHWHTLYSSLQLCRVLGVVWKVVVVILPSMSRTFWFFYCLERTAFQTIKESKRSTHLFTSLTSL